jgi:hypothetical protein
MVERLDRGGPGRRRGGAAGRALSAKVITAWAAASDIWSSAVPEKLAAVSQAWW